MAGLLDDEIQKELTEEFDYKKHLISKQHLKAKSKRYRDKKEPVGYKMGIRMIDDIIVMKPNEMHACTGKKGRGKTTVQQILFLGWAMANDLHCVLALQENEQSLEVNRFLGYCFGCDPKKVEIENPELFNKVENWFYDHFTFIQVDTLKEATQVVNGIKENGGKVDLLFCDPINSFESGFSDTGNSHKDDKITAMHMLKFTKTCSLFVSQHPTMSGQRSEEDVNSYSAEGGYFLNKAHFTWAINRDNGSNDNRISVDNVRNSYTGGDVTPKDCPLILEWGKYNINIRHYGEQELDILQKIRRMYNPFKEVFSEQHNWIEEKKELPNITPIDAFGEPEEDKDDIPF